MKISHILACTLVICFIYPTSVLAATTPVLSSTTEIEKRVREYFKDNPVMIEIARCESKFRQFTDSGNVLRSAGMIGVFQFYEGIHAPGAKALGFDLATVEGNLGYAKHVFATEGTVPWRGSSYCWDLPALTAQTKPLTTATVNSTTLSRAELQKQISTLTKLIALLQKQLAAKRALASR